MAKGKSPPAVGKDKSGSPGMILSMLVAILIGCVGGGAYGYFAIPVSTDTSAPPAVAPKAADKTEKTDPAGRFPHDALELPLPPIVVEIGSAKRAKVRLELSAIVVHGTPQAATLQSELREDTIAFMTGLEVADIEGARGFQNLREQLDDRARIRGRGAVLGLLVGGFVVE